MTFLSHQHYKGSGVAWLGDIPAHWDVKALKRGFSVVLGKMLQPESTGPDDVLLPYLRAANIKWDGVDVADIRKMWLTLRERAELRLLAGDLLVSEGGDVGRACIWAEEILECYFQNSVNRVRARDGNSSRLLYYWMSALKDRGYIDVLCNKSTIAHFTAEKVAAVPVPSPPPQEQLGIATFLDRETANLDALVGEQRRLMDLLSEKRQAVISQAVTKGLNPSAPMRPSGIEWLGDVPLDWTALQIGKVCRQVSDGPHFSPQYVDDGVLFLSARNVRVDSWSFNDVKYVSEQDCAEFDRRIIPQRGDVLYTKGGTTGVARVVDFDERFQVWVHIAVLKVKVDLVDPHYLAFALNSLACYEQSQLLTRGATNNDLGLTRMVKIWFALPPLAEQRSIVTFLRSQTHELDELKQQAQRAIDLLEERRTALVFAAVTGQIDVRGLDKSVVE